MSVSVGHVVILRTLACFVLCFGTPAAAARPVDLALVLAVDASRSIDEEEYRIQRDGYATAFGSRAVIEAIESGAIGAIAVTYVEWSGSGRQRQIVPWTIVSGPDTALAFADAIRRAPRTFADFTAIGSAIDFSAQLLEDGGFATPRRTIDISGDGVSNAGPVAADARDRAVARGITINGLAIRNEHWRLDEWYRQHVVGGFGSFVSRADDFDDFRVAIVAKLVREIADGAPPARGMPKRLARPRQP